MTIFKDQDGYRIEVGADRSRVHIKVGNDALSAILYGGQAILSPGIARQAAAEILAAADRAEVFNAYLDAEYGPVTPRSAA